MAYTNFNEALMSRTLARQRRKNILAGRDPSEGFEDIVSAGVSGAGETFTRMKQVELQEKALEEEKRRTTLQVRTAKEAGEREEKQAKVSGAVAGGAAGWMVGAKMGTGFGPQGMVIGAAAGYLLGGGSCIIISTCTDQNSYEVYIAREFRDKYLGDVTLTGYYRFSISIVPLIKKSNMLKWIIKKGLIDSLVKYGEWILGYKEQPSQLTILITESFLGLCKMIGNRLFLKVEEA